uniref:Uncharacterized protein n=1 Tax=Lygus hesperus TaxID=30085 RepID=A0A146LVC5_LYGHE
MKLTTAVARVLCIVPWIGQDGATLCNVVCVHGDSTVTALVHTCADGGTVLHSCSTVNSEQVVYVNAFSIANGDRGQSVVGVVVNCTARSVYELRLYRVQVQVGGMSAIGTVDADAGSTAQPSKRCRIDIGVKITITTLRQ